MELSKLIKDFVLNKENADLVVDLTRASTEYISDFVLGNDYSKSFKDLKNYINQSEKLKEINAEDFSIELVKYLYETRMK